MDYDKFLEQVYTRHSSNVKLGLDRMYSILQKMDNPEKKLKGIHIAGTNGKGSTAAMCESLLLFHGHKTGLNTSPHLIDYTERIRVNGENIAPNELMKLYEEHYELFEQDEASFFEITTALAFKHFSDLDIHSSIFEVGLGGRLDGTNPFNATVSIITSISIDHPKSLGSTVEQIAFEKAGIIKKNVPVVIGNMESTALDVILRQASVMDAPCFIVNRDFFVDNISLSNNGTSFDYAFPKYNISLSNLKTNLLGRHQASNAALALTAFFLYFDSLKSEYSENQIRESLQKVKWIGRLQILSENPLVIIDWAHNEEGVSALVSNLKEIFPNHKYHFVISILRDKKLEKMIKDICSIAEMIYITKNPSERAADLQEQINVAIHCDTKYVADSDLIESVKNCLASIDKEKDLVIITGSLYTIAEVLKHKDELF